MELETGACGGTASGAGAEYEKAAGGGGPAMAPGGAALFRRREEENIPSDGRGADFSTSLVSVDSSGVE